MAVDACCIPEAFRACCSWFACLFVLLVVAALFIEMIRRIVVLFLHPNLFRGACVNGSNRTIIIGDVHGCLEELTVLLSLIQPRRHCGNIDGIRIVTPAPGRRERAARLSHTHLTILLLVMRGFVLP